MIRRMEMDNHELYEMIESLKKIIVSDSFIALPSSGQAITLDASGKNYDFLLDINRQSYRRPKCTFQLRDKDNKSRILFRFDLIGKNHPNPPGDFEYSDMKISCPHVHIATHPLGTAYAYPLDAKEINIYLDENDYEDIILALKSFLVRINIANRNDFQYTLNEDII